jgi:Type IV secretion system pilin
MKSKTMKNLFVFVLLLLPVVTLAQQNAFTPLVGVPGLSGSGTNFNTYINALYALSISVAGLMAVIKIIIAGVKYMLTDIVTSKEEAKKDMQGALIGLLVVVSAVVILNQINPQLTQSSLFLSPASRAPAAGTAPSTTQAPLPPGTVTNGTAAVTNNTQACNSVTDPSTGANSYNCTPQQTACTNAGGRPFTGTNSIGLEVAGSINCLYGTELVTACSTTGDGSAGNPVQFECTAQLADCRRVSGRDGRLNSSGSGVICTIPYSSAYQRN